ncbi:hypothetical protein ColTof4_05630 [Colletotrichum tofieldiae]|nr:hypothetical protein ColTof3_00787 [Colletotrichum tofieldiae]GKT73207.1 hypothetical protein ColTof4_05630 [Colletotrichum tofieldiae]
MAYSFTEEEKRFILAEVIKTSDLDVGLLVGFLNTHNIEPDWLKMQLPSASETLGGSFSNGAASTAAILGLRHAKSGDVSVDVRTFSFHNALANT